MRNVQRVFSYIWFTERSLGPITLLFFFLLLTSCGAQKRLTSTGTKETADQIEESAPSSPLSIEPTCHAQDLKISIHFADEQKSTYNFGENVNYRLKVSGCLGGFIYKVNPMVAGLSIPSGNAFNGTYDFAVKYPLPGKFVVQATVTTSDASGKSVFTTAAVEGPEVTISAPNALNCMNLVSVPALSTIRRAFDGTLLDPAPSFTSSFDLPMPGYLNAAQANSKVISINGVIPTLAATLGPQTHFEVKLMNDSLMTDIVSFFVSNNPDPNKATFLGACHTKHTVVIRQLPPPPACSVSLSSTSVYSGDAITATLTTLGVVDSAKLDGKLLAPGIFSTTLTTSSLGDAFTITGQVINETAVTTCISPPYKVIANPNEIVSLASNDIEMSGEQELCIKRTSTETKLIKRTLAGFGSDDTNAHGDFISTQRSGESTTTRLPNRTGTVEKILTGNWSIVTEAAPSGSYSSSYSSFDLCSIYKPKVEITTSEPDAETDCIRYKVTQSSFGNSCTIKANVDWGLRTSR